MAASYKIGRAFELSHNPLPMARRVISDTLHTRAEILDRLTSAELAMVIDLLNHHWHAAVRHTEAEICAEGAVWDNRRQMLREVVLPVEK